MSATIFNVLAHFAVGFVIGLIIVSVVSTIWNRFKKHLNKKRVLQAVTELGIEDELANCIAGLDARCTIAIEQYFIKHGWGMPFNGADGNLELCCLIGELRTENRIKQLVNGGK